MAVVDPPAAPHVPAECAGQADLMFWELARSA